MAKIRKSVRCSEFSGTRDQGKHSLYTRAVVLPHIFNLVCSYAHLRQNAAFAYDSGMLAGEKYSPRALRGMGCRGG